MRGCVRLFMNVCVCIDVYVRISLFPSLLFFLQEAHKQYATVFPSRVMYNLRRTPRAVKPHLLDVNTSPLRTEERAVPFVSSRESQDAPVLVGMRARGGAAPGHLLCPLYFRGLGHRRPRSGRDGRLAHHPHPRQGRLPTLCPTLFFLSKRSFFVVITISYIPQHQFTGRRLH